MKHTKKEINSYSSTGFFLDALKELDDAVREEVPPNGLWLDPRFSCDHSWKEYVGLTERYEFCERCDKKKKT